MKGALSWPFLRLYLLTLLYFSGNSILNVIIPLKGESLGASNSMIGLIMGAYLLTTMFFRPWAGGLIQRYGPIRVLRVLLTVNALALLLYTFNGLEGYFLARVLQGVCTAFFSMALQLGVIEALPDKDRAQGISMYSLCSYLPGIFGPLLAIGMWQSGETDGMGLFAVLMIAIAIMTGVVGFTARIDGQPAAAESGGGERLSSVAENGEGGERLSSVVENGEGGERLSSVAENGEGGERLSSVVENGEGGERLSSAVASGEGRERRSPAAANGGSGMPRSAAMIMLRATAQLASNPHLFRCGVLMLSASVVFGAVTAFVPLYAPQIQGGNAAVYLMIQAAVVVAARFLLRSWIPSDGKWRSSFVGGLMLLLVTASLAVGLSPGAGAALFYTGAVLLGIAQALLYPTLTTYLSFVLPKAERGVLIGLFIATADLGVSLGGIIMGPVSDLTSYSSMYLICAALAAIAAAVVIWSRSRDSSASLQPELQDLNKS